MSHGYDPATAYKQTFPVHGFHFLTPPLGQMAPEDSLPTDITFKIRHTPEYHRARIEKAPEGGGRLIIHSEKPIHGVAPGQFCVVYDKDHHRCFGSAEITV